MNGKNDIRTQVQKSHLWILIIQVFLSLLVFLNGIVSNKVYSMHIGGNSILLSAYFYLRYYVKNEHRVIKALEKIIFILMPIFLLYSLVITSGLIYGVTAFAIICGLTFAIVFQIHKIRGDKITLANS